MVTVKALVVVLAWALSSPDLTNGIGSALPVAVTRLAVRVVIVAVTAGIAVRWQECRLALALTSTFLTVSSIVVIVAVARLADISIIEVLVEGSVVAGYTLVTVDALGVVLAVEAATTSLIVAMYVFGESLFIHLLIKYTLLCMTIAVTC